MSGHNNCRPPYEVTCTKAVKAINLPFPSDEKEIAATSVQHRIRHCKRIWDSAVQAQNKHIADRRRKPAAQYQPGQKSRCRSSGKIPSIPDFKLPRLLSFSWLTPSSKHPASKPSPPSNVTTESTTKCTHLTLASLPSAPLQSFQRRLIEDMQHPVAINTLCQ
ncbi:hypothetical protein AMECASPLE_009737 [Ameca splendens]|uniref:Uncharacterized protein n=1 Tax=Ameca splendens TaxID=208324 RepID=A0ABV0Y0Q5_9TELE